MSKKNTGIPFERVVHFVYQSILKQDKVENVEVKHDCNIQGRGTTHQIDVYWEFNYGGIKYATIVSCKDWKYRVKKEQVLSLQAILDDIPGQPRGVIVCKNGFQSGAIEYATEKGIILCTLTEEEVVSNGKSIVPMEQTAAVVEGGKIIIDDEWFQNECRSIEKDRPISLRLQESLDNLVFIDDDEREITCQDIIDEGMKSFSFTDDEGKIKHDYLFENPLFIKIDNEHLTKLRVLGITIFVELVRRRDVYLEISWDENFIKYVLRNIIDDVIREIPKQ